MSQLSQLQRLQEIVSEMGVYDVVTALRGPDVGNDDHNTRDEAAWVKLIVTAVIRHCAGTPPYTYGVVRSAQEAQESWSNFPESTQTAVRMFLAENNHFRGHATAAFVALAAMGSEEARSHYAWLQKEGLL